MKEKWDCLIVRGEGRAAGAAGWCWAVRCRGERREEQRRGDELAIGMRGRAGMAVARVGSGWLAESEGRAKGVGHWRGRS